MPDPKSHIISPFGLIGGQYEVDTAGFVKYLLACAIAAIFAGLLIFQRPLGVSPWLLTIAALVALAATMALCADVARKGRKL
jgi:hypothetical protein